MNPITYPARPINGGSFDQALEKSGVWFYEPKYNGWRTLIHVPSGTMFNRKGEILSIAQEFQASRSKLQKMLPSELEWADCEALERRHGRGCGSLIVLDCPSLAGLDYQQRRNWLERSLPQAPLCPNQFARNEILLAPTYADDIPKRWLALQYVNSETTCEFYEGLVAKRADSTYPIQLRSPQIEFPFWVKHRWRF
jgi:ATP-dependent DNA ligase